VKSKLITIVACAAALVLSQGVMAATQDQATPAASAASGSESAPGDRPASVDEDRTQPQPRLTAAMRNGGAAGTVVVMVQVGADNKPKSVHVMMSSGSKPLDDEAVRTVKTWSYKSAIKNGAPADGYVQIPFNFAK
jgi:TonB family protein